MSQNKSGMDLKRPFLKLRDQKFDFLAGLKDEKRLRESSLKIYEGELDRLLASFERILAGSHLNEEKTIHLIKEALRKELKQLSAATHSRKLIIWKSFLKSAAEPWKSLCSDFKLPKQRIKQPTFLTENESFQLEAACYKGRNLYRDRLFVALALQLGLRLNEILQSKFTDHEDGWFRIMRKGGKEQRLPLSESLKILLESWKRECPPTIEAWIFPGRMGRPMTSRAAQLLLKEIAKRAGIEKKISPHALRHTFATTMASRGAPLHALKEILGHERLATTERYMHVTPEHLKDALNLLHHRPKANSERPS